LKNNSKKIKYFIISIIKEFQKKNKKAYETSIRTILRGSDGPVANQFEHLPAHGKFANLTKTNYLKALNELLEENIIVKITNDKKTNHYYKTLSKGCLDTRLFFDDLFELPPGKVQVDNKQINDYYPTRDPRDSKTVSKKGVLYFETITSKNNEIIYESSYEKELIEDLSNCDYLKHVIEQPTKVMISSKGFYTPDFLIQTYHNHFIFLEIKLLPLLTNYSVLKKHNKLKSYAESNDMKAVLVTKHDNKWLTLKQIKDRKTNEHLEREILNIINQKCEFTFNDYKEVEKIIVFDEIDFHNVILNNNLVKKGSFNNFIITTK